MPEYINSFIHSSQQATETAVRLPAFPGLRSFAVAVILLALVLLASAFFVPVNVMVGFRAVAAPAGGIQNFRAPISGQVTFPFAEGQLVRAGSAVAVIDSNLVSSEMVGAADAAKSVALESFRVSDASLATTVNVLNQRLQLASSRSQTLTTAVTSIRNEVAIRARQLASANELLARAKTLGEQQLISGIQLASYQDRRLDLESAIEALSRQEREAMQTLRGNTAEMEELRLQIVEAKLANQRRKIEIDEAMESKLSQRRATIVAPSGSRLASLNLPSGAIVAEGESLLTLVPTSSSIVLEARVQHADIAMLEIGQLASVTFDALPRSTYGQGEGTVQSISFAASPTAQSTTTAPEGAYFVRVLLEKSSSPKLISAIRPGMVANVRIRVANRPIARSLLAEARR